MYECARMHIQCLAFGSFRIGNENAIEEGDKSPWRTSTEPFKNMLVDLPTRLCTLPYNTIKQYFPSRKNEMF